MQSFCDDLYVWVNFNKINNGYFTTLLKIKSTETFFINRTACGGLASRYVSKIRHTQAQHIQTLASNL